jgi:tripartite-type tricarboxylate transporter receptor subunit TctC
LQSNHWIARVVTCLTISLPAVLALLISAAPARGQTYPAGPIRVVVPYAAGGFSDISGRLIAERMSRILGQPWVLESRPGGGGRIGAESITHAPPDGYHLLFTTNGTHTYMAVTERSLAYDPIRDFTPVALIGTYGLQMVINPTVPAQNVQEFIRYARTHLGHVNYASSGNGSGVQFAGELFKIMAGVEMVHVPYKGTAPAVQDVIAGVCQVTFDGAARPFIDAGRVRFLGTTSGERDPRYPAVPTIGQAGLPGFDLTYWIGLFGPAGMSGPVQQRLNEAVNLALAEAPLRHALLELGVVPVGGRPEALPERIRSDIELIRRIAAGAKLKFD